MNEITLYLPGILLAYSAFVISVMSPGPNVLAVMGTSMAQGRKAGIALALGIGTGSFLWSTLTATGLSALLARYAGALIVIKVAGGLYLLWLAYKAFRQAASHHDIEARQLDGVARTPGQMYRRGLLIQMTNPKALMAWIAIISLSLQPGAPWWVAAAIFIGTSTLSVLFHVGYALVFSTAAMVRLYGKARRWIQGALGAFFAFAGLKLLVSRL
jgi:threonine/homoserine/homoserine lactone efflux protein